jgi:hypothetical protein
MKKAEIMYRTRRKRLLKAVEDEIRATRRTIMSPDSVALVVSLINLRSLLLTKQTKGRVR